MIAENDQEVSPEKYKVVERNRPTHDFCSNTTLSETQDDFKTELKI